MARLPDNEKKIEDMFIRFDRIHERNGLKEGQRRTPYDGTSRVCIASRFKNVSLRPPPTWSKLTMSGINVHTRRESLEQFLQNLA